MALRPTGAAAGQFADVTHINRIAKISQFDLVNPSPATLTLVKREVDTLDQLEISDKPTWTARLALLTDERTRRLFYGGNIDRLMYRYAVYGLDVATLQTVLNQLLGINYGKVKRWYRLQASSAVSGEWSSIVDVLGGNPITQSDADRKPAVGSSANGLPTAIYDGSDVMNMTLDTPGSGNNGTSQWWFAFRIKPVAFNVTQMLLGWTSAAGTAPNKLQVGFSNDGTGKLVFTVFSSGFNGRVYTTSGSFVAGAWNHGVVQFDGTRTNEFDNTGVLVDSKVRVFLGTTGLALTAVDTGTGGAVSALLSSTGTGELAGSNDSDTPTAPLLNGTQLGCNMQFGTVPMTSTELANLVAMEVLT